MCFQYEGLIVPVMFLIKSVEWFWLKDANNYSMI